jgi:hypothetical protein
MYSCANTYETPENRPTIVTNFGMIGGDYLNYYHDTIHKVGVWMHGESIFVLPDSQYTK